VTSNESQIVLFSLDGVLYGTDVHQVREVRELQDITPVPYAPFYVEGVTNLRGEVIPVIDLRKRFGIREKDKDERSKIMIVVQDEDKKVVGIIVDSVMEVMSISQNDTERTPDILTTADSDCVLGVAKRGEDLIILLDLQKVVSKKDVEATRTIEELAASSVESPMPETSSPEILG